MRGARCGGLGAGGWVLGSWVRGMGAGGWV